MYDSTNWERISRDHRFLSVSYQAETFLEVKIDLVCCLRVTSSMIYRSTIKSHLKVSTT